MNKHTTDTETLNSIDLQTILKEALDAGILDLSTEKLLKYIRMRKQQKKYQELLKQHIEKFYPIWQNNKGVYLSYLPAADKPKGHRIL